MTDLLTADPMIDEPIDVRSKLAAHGAEITSLKNGMRRVEGGIDTILHRLDSRNQPHTFAILSSVGGAVSLVLLAVGVFVTLTVDPLRSADDQIDKTLEVRAATTLKLLENMSETKQIALDAKRRASDSAEVSDDKSKMRHDELINLVAMHEKDREKWQAHHIAEITDIQTRMGRVESITSSNRAHGISMDKWIEKIDNIGTRNTRNHMHQYNLTE